MPPDRNAVLAAARAAFPAADVDEAIALLDRYGTAPGENERERVQLALIALSAGDRHRLERYLTEAKVDYRDVLARQALGPLPAAEGEALEAAARALIERWRRK